ncbi:MAG: hypothetical protein SGJ21_13845 [Alphaproteobacteria bacterium]|nr:hypothetical protein [Alphaproteobacteria bacterium]
MSVPWRLWIVVQTALAWYITAFGLQPGLGGLWWPVAGLWAAVAWASFGLSVWAAGSLIVLGVLIDFMTEAPIGAWPLALLSAYGVALVAWDRSPPMPMIAAELVAVFGGMVAAGLALAAAGSVAGQTGFSRDGLLYDFLLTAALYPAVRFILIPASIRGARR